jgi:hypothetical protein
VTVYSRNRVQGTGEKQILSTKSQTNSNDQNSKNSAARVWNISILDFDIV